MTYRETRSERAASARLHEPERRKTHDAHNIKFRWTCHKETESPKRDWFGFINLDRPQAELLVNWLQRRLQSPDYTDADGEIVLLLSGWNNTGRNGLTYIGGVGGPSLTNKSLPAKGTRFN